MRANRMRRLIASLGDGLLEKEEALRLVLLAAIAGENTFLYGPPGVAKSLLARRIAQAFRDARTFEYLLGRFTTPEELFGPVSISRLKDADRFERVVDGFLPTAEVVFLDEIWNASSPILNTLLTAINEHRFRNGSEELSIPLRTVIGAAGTLMPEEPGLNNLWDRFLLRVRVVPVEDRDSFVRLLTDTEAAKADTVAAEDKITADELDEWSDGADSVEIPADITDLVVDIRERISRHNSMQQESDSPHIIAVSDRRWRQAARLLRTSAYLNDRSQVDALDCAILRHCLWSREADIPVVDTIISEALRRYSTSGRFDTEALRGRLSAVLTHLQEASTVVSEEEQAEPVEYRGEYYRVAELVDDHVALLWIGDYRSLTEDEPTDTDVFYYSDDDDYAYSERLPIRKLSDGSLEIDGQAFELETQPLRKAVAHAVEPEKSVRSEIRGELETLRGEIDGILGEISSYRDRTTDEAQRHLFVHRSYGDILFEGMQEVESAFLLARSDATAAIASLDDSESG